MRVQNLIALFIDGVTNDLVQRPDSAHQFQRRLNLFPLESIVFNVIILTISPCTTLISPIGIDANCVEFIVEMEMQDSFFLNAAVTAEVIHPILGKILIGEQFFSLFVIIRSQPVDRLTSQDLDRIAGVTTHQKSAIMSHNFILALRKQVHNQILIVIGVGNHGEIVVGIDFSQQTLDVSNFITIDCEIGTHDRVLGGNCAKADRFIFNIALIMMFHPHNCRNGCGVMVAQQPSRRSLDCRFNGMLTAHREVTDHLPRRYISAAGLFNPLINHLTIAITDFSSNLSMPHRAGQQSFDSIYQPDEVGVGIGNFDLRNANLSARTLGNRTNCQRQVTQFM